jgi:hypothetical protein
MKMLRVIGKLKTELSGAIKATFLGAHVPYRIQTKPTRLYRLDRQ